LFFLFFEAKERNPKTSETKDIARELAVDRGSASQVGQDLWSLDSNFEQLVPNNLKNEEEKKYTLDPGSPPVVVPEVRCCAEFA